jgi:peptide/nickel transport system substrate-binding protein
LPTRFLSRPIGCILAGGVTMRGSRSWVAGLTMLAALAFAGAATPAGADNVLRYTADNEVQTFDPHSVWHHATTIATGQIYERLLNVSCELELEPALATAWRTVDPLTWEFELRPGVRFHDGTPLTAEDVVFSIDRARGKVSEFNFMLDSVERVEAVEPGTVRIVTTRPNALLPMQVRVIGIMSEQWAKRHGLLTAEPSDAAQEPYASLHANGTGPFRLVAVEPHQSYVLERNPDWWGRELWPHNVDRIEFATNYDYAAALEALLDGRTTFLPWALPDQFERLKRAPGIKLEETTTIRSAFLVLNQGSAELESSNVRGRNPFKDRRVRQALYQAIDVERLIRDDEKGYALPAGMPIGPLINGYAPELDQRLPYDPEKAKALLAEAGYGDGFSVQMDIAGGWTLESETIAAMLGQVGIEVDTVVQPPERMLRKIARGDTDFYLRGLGYGTLDSLEAFKVLYRSGVRNHVNATGYSDRRVDALIDALEAEMSPEGRGALIDQLWRIVLDEIVYVPLFHIRGVWAMREELDLPIHPYLYPIFRYAHMRPGAGGGVPIAPITPVRPVGFE